LKIYANDTVNIRGLNNSFVVLVDTTAPTASASCSPSSVVAGETFPCSCSGTDVTAGLNSSANSGSTTSPDGVSIEPVHDGVFTYTCSVTDYSGNAGTMSATYTVTLPISRSSGSGSSTTTSFYTKSIPKTNQDFSEIKTIETSSFSGGGLAVKEKVTFKLNEELHYIGVKELTSSSVKIEIASTPIEVDMNIGEEKKIDLDSDGYYDLQIIMNGIADNKADLTINYIHEAISTSEEIEQIPEDNEEVIPISVQGENNWVWIVVAFLFILAGFFIWHFYFRKLMKEKHR
jgi:hypothetical protein